MSLFEDATDYFEHADPGADHARGNGFEPSACRGCPHRLEETRGKPCDLCGCPTTSGLLMDRMDAPPADCIRLGEHASRSR